jgi:hypothetical protein
MTPLFSDEDVFASDSFMTLWRRRDVVCVSLQGVIDDERSFEWRRALDAEYEAHGFPRFVAFEMSKMESIGSIQNRAAVASYVRDMMHKVEWAALHTRMRPTTTIVVRIVMLASSVRNVTLCTSDEQFNAQVSAMLAGHRA